MTYYDCKSCIHSDVCMYKEECKKLEEKVRGVDGYNQDIFTIKFECKKYKKEILTRDIGNIKDNDNKKIICNKNIISKLSC